MAQAQDPASVWLSEIERRLVAVSGQQITTEDTEVIFYAPLATIWRLEGETVTAAGRVRGARTADGATATITWGRGAITRLLWPDPIPVIPGGDGKLHPLARFHDRLLSTPLAADVGALPAGSRFTPVVSSGPGGVVHRPDAPARATLWQSFGDRIAITHPDGTVTLHGWQEVDAALRGGAE